MHKLKILHCLETIRSGGVEQRRILIAKAVSGSNYEMQIICSKVEDTFKGRFDSLGVKVHPIGELGKITNMRYYFKLLQVVRSIRPDIIHGAVFEGNISAVLAGMFCRVPVIIIEETSDPRNRSKRASWLLWFLSLFSDFVVAISPSASQYLQADVGVKHSKLRLIQNGVAVPTLPSVERINTVRDTYGLSESNFVVGSVGRLRDFHKRFSDLIKAVSLLKHEIPEIKLIIVGDGEDRGMLEGLTKELDVAANVVFAGYQEDTGPFYSCMDVFSLASFMEGFGLVVVEAMMFGLPVVATSVGGIPHIVLEGETGILVPPKEPTQLAYAIKRLYHSDDLRNAMGDRGKIRAMQNFSEEAYVSKVINLYDESASIINRKK